MVRNFVFSTITALILIGCIGTTHNFKIRFNDVDGLRKNDQVFFDQTPIGVVTDVEYTDTGNYLVRVAVEDQYSSLWSYPRCCLCRRTECEPRNGKGRLSRGLPG